ncbi:hypothetical protein J6352_01630 [Burkholderia pseudomallei]|uniref:hypothetical protein n=1 Tax=Burkholderia pseudomallei TaxID=28450 RepID=UPI001AD79D2C|nr:hypothetical protein [Burkholderia pseudomallei]MBO7771351.1 hypothetical protein [Burkholderia pseudomallei]MBO7904086.1 hypothetical protein [Burkholderia pseudomallei]
MTRIVIIALVAAVLAGCASDPRQGRRGTPPQDPPDYQGVPTDMTPPSMLGEPDTGGAAATPAK